MANFRTKTELRPRYLVDGTPQSLANDGLRRNLQDLNDGPFVDGVRIDNVSVQGNIPLIIKHNLGRPAKNVNVIRVDSTTNQVTVRIDQSNYALSLAPTSQVVIRPSATGVISLWIS